MRNREWSGISSGLSLATAALNLEIKHLYYSEFKTLFCLDVLKGSCVTSCYRQDSYLYFFCPSDCVVGFAIVCMGSLGWDWKLFGFGMFFC